MARDTNRSKPWKAEVKHLYKARFLGYFATQAEAEAAERKKRLELTGVEHPLIGGQKEERYVSS
jgi:hypothetical protein